MKGNYETSQTFETRMHDLLNINIPKTKIKIIISRVNREGTTGERNTSVGMDQSGRLFIDTKVVRLQMQSASTG